MTYLPTDHLPKSLRDNAREKAQEAIEHRRALYAHAARVSRGLLTLTIKQPKGDLTRAEGAVLSRMVLANLRASARGELNYRPGRAVLARDTGYSERTVSKALTRLKALGLIKAARYAKGGRVDKHGLVTEWRSGGLDGLIGVLRGLGYRLGRSIADTVSEAVNWVRVKLSKRFENKGENQNPTGKLVPGTLVCKPKANPGCYGAAPANTSEGHVGWRSASPEMASLRSKCWDLLRRSAVASGAIAPDRPAASPGGADLVPMAAFASGWGDAGRGYLFALSDLEVTP